MPKPTCLYCRQHCASTNRCFAVLCDDSIVRLGYRQAWASMNRHDYEAILKQLAPAFAITFVGDTALGGTRHTKLAMRRWFERFFLLFPDARFVMREMAVDGWPWNTRVFGAFEIHATVLGEPYRNVFVQAVTLSWGRIKSYTVYEDSLKFWQTAQAMGRRGIREATSPPIRDED